MAKSTTTQSPGPTIEQFTLNFTITNLRFTTDLRTPSSAKFSSTEKIMQHYVSTSHIVFHWNHPVFWVSHSHKDLSLSDWSPASEKQHWSLFHWLQSNRIQVSNIAERLTLNLRKWISLCLANTLILVLFLFQELGILCNTVSQWFLQLIWESWTN